MAWGYFIGIFSLPIIQAESFKKNQTSLTGVIGNFICSYDPHYEDRFHIFGSSLRGFRRFVFHLDPSYV